MSGYTPDTRIFDDLVPVYGMRCFFDHMKKRKLEEEWDPIHEAESILVNYETPDDDFELSGYGPGAYGRAYDEFMEGLDKAVRVNRETSVGDEEIEELYHAMDCIHELIDDEWEVRRNRWGDNEQESSV